MEDGLATSDVIVGTLLSFGSGRWFSPERLLEVFSRGAERHESLLSVPHERRHARELAQVVDAMSPALLEEYTDLRIGWYRLRPDRAKPAEQFLEKNAILPFHNPLFDELARELALRPT